MEHPGSERPRTKILLVDDHAPNLLALEGVLESLGQELVKAHSGREALHHLLNDDFSLILLDVNMPEMDGFETARLIHENKRTQHIPIIFVSAVHKSDSDVQAGYALGAVDYVLKPFVPEILKAKVDRLVRYAVAGT